MANAIPTTAGLPDNPPAPVIEAICARFREAGVMLFEDILSGAHVERLLDAYAARYARYHRDVDHRDARRVGDARHMITIGVSGAFNDPAVYAPPPVMPVVRGLLGEDAILGSFVAVTSLPGSADQEAHLDTPPLFGTGTAGAEMPPHCLTLVIPLVEMNARHGTTAFFSRNGRARRRDTAGARSGAPRRLRRVRRPFRFPRLAFRDREPVGRATAGSLQFLPPALVPGFGEFRPAATARHWRRGTRARARCAARPVRLDTRAGRLSPEIRAVTPDANSPKPRHISKLYNRGGCSP